MPSHRRVCTVKGAKDKHYAWYQYSVHGAEEKVTAQQRADHALLKHPSDNLPSALYQCSHSVATYVMPLTGQVLMSMKPPPHNQSSV
jgi:hypothetical protein